MHWHPLSSLFGFTENHQWGFYTSTFRHSFNLPLGTGECHTFFLVKVYLLSKIICVNHIHGHLQVTKMYFLVLWKSHFYNFKQHLWHSGLNLFSYVKISQVDILKACHSLIFKKSNNLNCSNNAKIGLKKLPFKADSRFVVKS